MPKAPPQLGRLPGAKRRSWGKAGDGSRQSRGYGAEWDRLRARILKRDKYLCQACRRGSIAAMATDVDHIRPRHLGGGEDDGNLQALCGPCHRAKTSAEAKAAAAGRR
ncbi:MAG: Klebsiella phage phiKO2 [Pseudomonadota bacterium]|jgi:5-methylcytosine-specific restriction protein A